MRKHLVCLAFAVALGGPVLAQEVAPPSFAPPPRAAVAPVVYCQPVVTLELDETRPGVLLARYDEKPHNAPTTCTPYAGTVTWFVSFCASYQDDNCDTYVVVKARRRARFVFTPDSRIGIHTVTVAPWGIVPPVSASAYYRRTE